MGVRKAIKKTVTSGLSPKRWVGLDQIKENAGTVKNIAKAVLKPGSGDQDEIKQETFEQALVRLNITEEDLKKRMESSKYIVWFCSGLSLSIFIYMFYLWSQGQIVSGVVCFMLSFVLGAYAFREHFNLFQMKQRRLGCSIREWYQSLFSKGSK